MLRKLILTFVISDNFVSNLVKKPFRTHWVLEGECRKCGKCCRDISLKIDARLLNNRFTSQLVIRWISWLFNFYLKRIDQDMLYLVFGCKNLSPDGSCRDYKWRPNICRNYPIVDYFYEPALFDTCGYKTKRKL